MRLLLTICLCLAFYSLCSAQTDSLSLTDRKIKNKIRELHDEKIDTIICSSVDCIGYVRAYKRDSCVAEAAKYLLWVKAKSSFIQRFDECLDYPPMPLAPGIFSLLKSNFDKIERERLKYPEYSITTNGKKQTYTSIVDHSCHTFLKIFTPGKIIEKDLDNYALETKYVDGRLNKNYYPNQKSPLTKLKSIIELNVDAYNYSITKKALH